MLSLNDGGKCFSDGDLRLSMQALGEPNLWIVRSQREHSGENTHLQKPAQSSLLAGSGPQAESEITVMDVWYPQV